MSFSSSDLQVAVDKLLDELGYEISGDDNDGWTWRFGGHKASSSAVAASRLFDEASEATVSSMHDLVGCIDDILGTGRTVIERWESGDLAQAVRELQGALRMLDPTADVDDRAEAIAERRAARLRRLIVEGLSLDDCIQAFGCKSMDAPQVRSAALEHVGDDGMHVAESGSDAMGHLTTIRNVQQAVTAVQSDCIDDVIDARAFAEYLGDRAFHSKENMPAAFAHHPVLAEGFDNGYADAACARELIRQGWL